MWKYLRSRPDSHRPADDIYFFVFVQVGLLKVEGTIVVANHQVAIGGTIRFERCLVCSPASEEQEQARVMLVYEVDLLHNTFF